MFGVNLGGIPGGNWQHGFLLFCLILLLMVGGVAVWLKKRNWL